MSATVSTRCPLRRRDAVVAASLVASAGLCLALSSPARATDFVWSAANTGLFSDSARWTPTGVPSAVTDTATVSLDGVYTVTIDTNLAIGSLAMSADGATLSATNRTIDVADLFALSAGTGLLVSSSLGGAGTLDLSGGSLLLRGATSLNLAGANAGLMWVNGASGVGAATLTLNNTLTNSGALRMESQNAGFNSLIVMGGGGAIVNQPGCVIEVNTGTGGARSITGGSLTNAGSIVTNAALTLSGVAYNSAGGSIGASHTFTNSTITVSASTPGGATLHLQGANLLASDNLPGTTLWVRGSGSAATLSLADGLTNHGAIRMESLGAGFDNTVQVAGGSLTNAADGALQVNVGPGGNRTFVGSLVNEGLISVQSGALLNFTDATPFSLAHEGGLIDAQGEVRVTGGSFLFAGGDIAGAVRVVNGTIETLATAGTGLVQAAGLSNLTSNLGENVVVQVRGGAGSGHATMGLTGDAENRGVIRMQSVDAGWTSNINSGTYLLTNQSDARIEANVGSGGNREFRGFLLNRGEIAVEKGAFLSFISADYTADGGIIEGNHAFSGASVLRTTATPAARGGDSTLVAVGNAIQFEDDIENGYELWVRGGGFGGHAATTIATDGASNRGVIRLESIDVAWTSELLIAGGSFTNSANGRIDVITGTGGLRRVRGDGYTFTNRGDLIVAAGSTLDFSAENALTVRQAQGLMNGAGAIDIIEGYFNVTGGAISGTIRVSNSELRIADSFNDDAEIIAAGASRLRENLSPTTTVWVQGSGLRGGAALTADNPSGSVVENRGTIRLESIDAGWDSRIASGPDTLYNSASGVIDVHAGSGGARRIEGSLRNAGLVTVQDGALLTLTNLAYSAEGGAVLGEHAFSNSTISFAEEADQQHTLRAIGAGNSVLTDITAGHELWVRGSGLGGGSHVTLASGAANHGVIRLQSVDAGWGAGVGVAGNGRFTNAADGEMLALAGTGGARTIGALLANHGSIEFTTSATLTGDADVGAVTNSGDWTINTTGTVAMNSSVATRTTFQNSGVVEGVGGFALDAGAGSFINSGLISPGFDIGAISIQGRFEQTSVGMLALDFAAPGTANGDRINITGAASLDGGAEVTLLSGYVPDWGDRWSILTYTSVAGDLDVSTPSLADPLLRWWTEATTDSFDIGVRHVADINHDDFVDFADLNLVLSFFNTSGEGLPGDANEDGAVDFADLNLVVSFFNTAAPANVPSPSAAALAALGLMAGVRSRSRRES